MKKINSKAAKTVFHFNETTDYGYTDKVANISAKCSKLDIVFHFCDTESFGFESNN